MSRKFLTNIDMNSNQLLNALAQVLAGDPASPVEGQFWYDSVAKTFQFRTDTTSINLGRLDQITAPTGDVSLNSQKITNLAVPSSGTDATNRNYVLGLKVTDLTAPTGSFSMNSQKITNLADGTAATDAVNKGQLDAARSGLDVKASVRAASTADIGGTYNSTGGASAHGQFTSMPDDIDGVSLAANDRVLLKDQTNPDENGIYVVTTLGTGANGVWDRATDFDTNTEVTGGAFTFITEGTANADTGWVLVTDDPIIVGTGSGSDLDWSKFTAAATGVQKYIETGPGAGGSPTWAVTHSLGTANVVVQVRDASTDLVVEPDITLTDANTVTLTSSANIGANSLKVVVIG